LTHRLFEFTWKGQLRSMYPTVQAYQSVLADVATYTGALTLANMFVSRLIFKYLGWGVAASVTPVVMGVAGCVFFAASVAAGTAIVPETLTGVVVAAGATAGVVTQVSRHEQPLPCEMSQTQEGCGHKRPLQLLALSGACNVHMADSSGP
jgi:AAA family ATP:ADP antiporter